MEEEDVDKRGLKFKEIESGLLKHIFVNCKTTSQISKIWHLCFKLHLFRPSRRISFRPVLLVIMKCII